MVDNTMKKNKYIISTALYALMEKWANSALLEIPRKEYFDDIAVSFKSKLSEYSLEPTLITEDEYDTGMKQLSDDTLYPVISLDRNYTKANALNVIGNIDLTRAVDSDLNSIGLIERDGSSCIKAQANKINNCGQIIDVCLLDDVLFSGSTCLDVVQMLKPYNINVKSMSANIAMDLGIQKLQENDLNVSANFIFKDAIEEVCIRDFIPGAPLSGRTVQYDDKKQSGVPYILPFGKLGKWASIPEENRIDFSLFSLETSIDMWSRIEDVNNSRLFSSQLPRKIFGINKDDFIVNQLKCRQQKLLNTKKCTNYFGN